MCEGWGHGGQVRVLPSDQNYQPAHFLLCFSFLFFFSFSRDICFPPPPTLMATISYISQLLCLFVGRGDNGAVFLNAQVVSPFVFSHSPPLPHLSTRSLTSRSPLPSPRRLTCTPPASQCLSHLSSPILSFLPPLSGYLPHLMPPSLSPFLSFAGFADSWETEHKSILFITPALHPP